MANLKVLSFDRTYARLTWTVPALKGADADLAGYRVIMLRKGAKTPSSQNDGTVVCRNDDPRDNICDALNLETGKKVTFAVYALDEVPNYSPPVVISMVPHSVDKKPPHKPTKVLLTHAGLTYTLKWVSPKDRDLSKFRVTLYDKGPAPKPSKGKVVGQGRVLHATFTLTPGKRVYVNLFALDVTGNFSRVTRLIVAPGKARSCRRARRRRARAVTKPPAKKVVKKPVPAKTIKKPAPPEKPIPVDGGGERLSLELAQRGAVDDPDDLAVDGRDLCARQRLAAADARQRLALALAEREDQHEARAVECRQRQRDALVRRVRRQSRRAQLPALRELRRAREQRRAVAVLAHREQRHVEAARARARRSGRPRRRRRAPRRACARRRPV